MRILGGTVVMLVGVFGLSLIARVALLSHFLITLAAGQTSPLSRAFPKTFNKAMEQRHSLGTRTLTRIDSRVVRGSRRILPQTILVFALAVTVAVLAIAAGLRLLLAF
jgi:ABC-type antimicrobial peptide transport system permease subunit